VEKARLEVELAAAKQRIQVRTHFRGHFRTHFRTPLQNPLQGRGYSIDTGHIINHRFRYLQNGY
jgi:hypothetical protein